jgi:hypothetical protein
MVQRVSPPDGWQDDRRKAARGVIFGVVNIDQVHSMNAADEKAASQLDKFKQAARELETDDDPERFKERVGKLVKHKPVERSE